MGKGDKLITDSIEVVQGALGSGKSMMATLECIAQLKRGGVVATNYGFSPTWAWDLAGIDLKVRLGIRNRFDLAMDLYSRAFKIGNPESMIELSGDQGSRLAELITGKAKKEMIRADRTPLHKIEGKGLLVLDDCHHFFNSRNYRENTEYVGFFANARKYGWRTLLITHDIGNIDKQIQSYVETESVFRNLRKVNVPYTPIPLTPFVDMFLIVRRYAGKGAGKGMIKNKDVFMKDKITANMYDTLELFNAENVLEEAQNQGLNPASYVFGPITKGVNERRPVPITREKEVRLIGQAECYPLYRKVVRL